MLVCELFETNISSYIIVIVVIFIVFLIVIIIVVVVISGLVDTEFRYVSLCFDFD